MTKRKRRLVIIGGYEEKAKEQHREIVEMADQYTTVFKEPLLCAVTAAFCCGRAPINLDFYTRRPDIGFRCKKVQQARTATGTGTASTATRSRMQDS